MAERIFWSIREVSELIGVPASTLRYWEKVFENIHPKKSTSSDNRRYTAADIEELRKVHFLVKEKGLPLAEAARRLKSGNADVDSQMELKRRLLAVREELETLRRELDGCPVPDADGQE